MYILHIDRLYITTFKKGPHAVIRPPRIDGSNFGKGTMEYRKYTYWVNARDIDTFRAAAGVSGLKPRWARGVVCSVLDPITSVGVVPPQTWEETCDRQGSWYRCSAHAGRYVVVSSSPLDLPGCEPNTRITGVDFSPPRSAGEEDVRSLLQSPAYRDREPAEWPNPDERERKRWAVMLARAGIAETIDSLLKTHSANHANFMKPVFFVRSEGRIIPYSINRSDRLCSCCLEFYNIIGSDFTEKLVRPCLGALYFARLERDRFYRVETLRSLAHSSKGKRHE